MLLLEELTTEVLNDRFNSLPDTLKEALVLPTSVGVVNQVCNNHHLADEEKKEVVQFLVSLVIFGFTHSYDLGKEINETLGLNNPKLAESIAQELSAKIFAPIKAEVDGNYQPLVTMEARPAPVIMREVEKPAMTAMPPPKPLGISTFESGKPQTPESITSVFVREPKSPVPSVKDGAPTPPAEKLMLPGMPTSPRETFPGSAPSPATPSGEKKPTPFLLHEESAFQPLKKTPTFNLDILSEMQRGEKAAPAPPPKPAKVEFGGPEEPLKQPPPSASTPISPAAPQVVHYSDLKTLTEDPKPPIRSEPPTSFKSFEPPSRPPVPRETSPLPSPEIRTPDRGEEKPLSNGKMNFADLTPAPASPERERGEPKPPENQEQKIPPSPKP